MPKKTKSAPKKAAESSPVKAKKAAPKVAAKAKKMPTDKELVKLRAADAGFNMASQDAVQFIQSRRQAMFNIARHYHLDPEELLQEAYEILLTCLRDYSPVYEKASGEVVSVQFTTFFGNRMESRAMEMRNRDPEYQARQAYTSAMSNEEKDRFRSDPPLLVQHLDQETTMQESLRHEAAAARDDISGNLALKVMRDSFFEKKLNELVAREKDDKKRAALMHVKVGGVYNFQDVAYHFGVTDSRASQIMNDLMDAFYIQRMIDGDGENVAYDFSKLKFNEKRAIRLIVEAVKHMVTDQAQALVVLFDDMYPELNQSLQKTQKDQPKVAQKEEDHLKESSTFHGAPAPMEEVLTAAENKKYPLVNVTLRPITSLKPLDVQFRPPSAEEAINLPHIAAMLQADVNQYPLLVTEEGVVVDGVRRLAAATAQGLAEIMCMTRHITDPLAAGQLRVSINARYSKLDKTEMYYAICALADLGLSQQKIADALDTSRTNVIVYAKVKDKATAKLRQLFEDGLIQITNASTCVELSDNVQDRLADFIRLYGNSWAKGSQFNELFEAAKTGKMDKLEKRVAPSHVVEQASQVAASTPQVPTTAQAQILQTKLDAYQQALKDAEIWTAQRESVINRQTEELVEARNEIEALKREIDATELMRYGDPGAMEEAFKEIKAFYGFVERLAAATHGVEKAAKQLRQLGLNAKQVQEVQDLIDKLEQHVNHIRIEVVNKTKSGTGTARRPNVASAPPKSS